MSSSRRSFNEDEDVCQAGCDAYLAVRATWVDDSNPTPEEEVAAKNARLQAMKDAIDAKLAE